MNLNFRTKYLQSFFLLAYFTAGTVNRVTCN